MVRGPSGPNQGPKGEEEKLAVRVEGKKGEVDFKLGCHVKISGGLLRAVDRALERGCRTFQVFLSNPRGWKGSDAIPPDLEELGKRCERDGLEPIFIHTIYLVNLATPSEEVFQNSVSAVLANLRAADVLGRAAVVTHLGSHGGMGEEEGLRRVVEGLRLVMERHRGDAPLLLETTAGSGGTVGHSFSQLGRIIRALGGDPRLGVCLDTCHVFAAGYEVRTKEGLEVTLREAEKELGPGRLRLVHANDSKGKLGSRVDRHVHLGEGEIGVEGFRVMLAHPLLRGLPWILETPEMTVEADRKNMELLLKLYRES